MLFMLLQISSELQDRGVWRGHKWGVANPAAIIILDHTNHFRKDLINSWPVAHPHSHPKMTIYPYT